MTSDIAEDAGHSCAGVAVQGMKLRSMNCAEGENGFVCEMPGLNISFGISNKTVKFKLTCFIFFQKDKIVQKSF